MRLFRRTSVTLVLVLAAGCGASSGQEGLTPVSTPTASTPEATATTSPEPPASTAGRPTETSTTSPPGTPSTVATPRPIVLTDADNGQTVHLHPHERLEVRLSQDSYDPPTSGRTQVLARRSSTGGYPGSAPVRAVFEAVAAGQADVSSSSDYSCFHSSPRCLRPSRLWVLHVIVG